MRSANEVGRRSRSDCRRKRADLDRWHGHQRARKNGRSWSCNIGDKQGVKIGMPLQVMRGDQIDRTVRVVDVRQKIGGAVIQEMNSEKDQIKVGDHLKVDAHQ